MAKRKSVNMERQGGAITPDQKEQSFLATIDRINQSYGENSIMKLSDRPRFSGSIISTGSLSLDIALGVGGLPRGRIVEIFGAEGSGKTSLSLHVIAEAQKTAINQRAAWEALSEKDQKAKNANGELVNPEPPQRAICAIIDVEHALDPKRAAQLGVDIDTLYISQPDGGESALGILENLVMSNAADVIVLDSVAALVPRAELEGEMGDAHVGLQARLMGQAIRRITAVVGKTNTLVIFINQTRDIINGMAFGPKTTTPGGKALKFAASVRIEISRIASIKDQDGVVGNTCRVKVVKNKVAPPMREATFDLMFYEGGISKENELLDLGRELGLVDVKGAYYRLASDGSLLGQGKPAASAMLKQKSDLAQFIEDQIRSTYFSGVLMNGLDGFDDDDLLDVYEE